MKYAWLPIVALLGGCAASVTPNYDLRFGDAVRAARLAQTINPAGVSDPNAVAGMDGKSAREAAIRYQDSFKAPPPVVNVINIGGAISGGQ
ncbi:hypothetical protein [Ramlibacter sp.]|uniref:hypothetical protein n=1 Tax=Ramlibacter sp. TaxID=1917967 RepID=UPI002B6CAD17|nr:hypothetical protein [Ramlibacter sp.]HWI81811.1 hypothetical protein [Ramlibacter sp.]